MRYLTFALTKGRLARQTLALLEQVGITCEEMKDTDSRKLIFVNEELVLGLSAVTFEELVKQRDRWCRGNLQVLKHFNPIFMKGLSFSQRIAYFDGAVYWFSNLQKMITYTIFLYKVQIY